MSSRGSAKKNGGAAKGRASREKLTLSIRKEKREGGLAKRRMEAWGEKKEEDETTAPCSSEVSKKPLSVSDFPSMMDGLRSNNLAVQIMNLKGFRRLLSAESNPPVQECIDCGAIPLFIDFLKCENSHDLQFEAAWALTNIASTNMTRVIVDMGAIPHLVALLDSTSPDVREQAAWALGNVAGDGPAYRDEVLGYNAMELLLKNISQPATLSLLKNATWTLSNFCRGKPQPSMEVLRPALPALSYLISSQVEDKDTKVDAAWAVSYVSDGSNERIQSVVDHAVVPSLINMLKREDTSMMIPALRSLGNIVSGSDVQTQAVLDAGLLDACLVLLQVPKKSIRKETCWTVSNIAAGTSAQLDQLMEREDILSLVLSEMSSGAEWDVRKEAVWVLSNAATAAKGPHLLTLLRLGALKPICECMVDVRDSKVLMCCLEALEAFLKLNLERADIDVLTTLDECGGIEALENLQEHENDEVYQKAVELIETYCNDEEDEGENLVPEVGANNQFSFGLENCNNNGISRVSGDSKLDFGNKFTQNTQSQFNFSM